MCQNVVLARVKMLFWHVSKCCFGTCQNFVLARVKILERVMTHGTCQNFGTCHGTWHVYVLFGKLYIPPPLGAACEDTGIQCSM